jgi:hypothetical protein
LVAISARFHEGRGWRDVTSCFWPVMWAIIPSHGRVLPLRRTGITPSVMHLVDREVRSWLAPAVWRPTGHFEARAVEAHPCRCRRTALRHIVQSSPRSRLMHTLPSASSKNRAGPCRESQQVANL